MRIGIDANPIVGDRGGVGWHLYHLLRTLVELKEDVEFVCYVRPGALASLRQEAWMADPRIRWVEAGRLWMRWRGSRDRLDLYHGPNFRLQTEGRCGGVVTIHDLWLDRHPEYSPKFFGQRLSFRRTRRTAWRARKVVTVSEFSAREIRALYGLPAERIAVIHNGVSGDFHPIRDGAAMKELRGRLGLPAGGFILFVGGADPRKNHRAFLQAAARRLDRLGNRMLVLVGDPIHRFGNYAETAKALGLEHRVVCTGRLAIEEMRLLYSHADLFVFPSLYEGFGMPVLEAMACGAPVITSNTTALPEVAGDAALLVNPGDPAELADAMVRLLDDQVLHVTLREKGFQRAKQFTWERAARQTLAVYRDACR
ncbi:MAG: glycosyltransferase family 1 protein [Nitrospirota bacterium]